MAERSHMLALGTKAPHFSLPDTVSGETISLEMIAGAKATVVAFLCNHCPYVQHINGKLVDIANSFQPEGVSFVGISSNDIERYPDDRPELMKIVAEEVGYPFPYLYDETQEVARAYRAACTPDFFVFDGELLLVYRGRMDASTPGNNEPNDGSELVAALSAILDGKNPPDDQIPSIGCGIKWKTT